MPAPAGSRRALATAVIVGAGFLVAWSSTSPTAAQPASCAAITTRTLGEQARVIERALRSASADAAKHGTSGAYAVAAKYSRDLLQRSHDRMMESVRWLQAAGSPSTITYAQGGHIKEVIRPTFEWMSQAAHWATVSAAYHKSSDARDAFNGAVVALERGNVLYGEAGRCYMGGYLP